MHSSQSEDLTSSERNLEGKEKKVSVDIDRIVDFWLLNLNKISIEIYCKLK